MMSRFCVLGFLLPMLLCGQVNAQAVQPESRVPHLFEIVEADDPLFSRPDNDYFIKFHTYAAKNSKVVRVNTSLLISPNTVRIEFFEGRYIDVRSAEIRYRNERKVLKWKGQIVDPNITDRTFLDSGITDVDDITFLKEKLLFVSITGSVVSYDSSTRTKYTFGHAEFDSYRQRDFRGGDIYEIAATFDVPADPSKPVDLITRYILQPLYSEMGYHLLVEVDPERYVGESLAEGQSQESNEKRREYEEFVRSLGPNPANLPEGFRQ